LIPCSPFFVDFVKSWHGHGSFGFCVVGLRVLLGLPVWLIMLVHMTLQVPAAPGHDDPVDSRAAVVVVAVVVVVAAACKRCTCSTESQVERGCRAKTG